jgi:hypothetical protein
MQVRSSPALSFNQGQLNFHLRPYQPNFNALGNHIFPRHPRGYRAGYSPYFYGGYGSFGYPNSYLPYYGPVYNCDPSFSMLPSYCQPLYPYGAPPYDPEGYRGDDYRYTLPSEDSYIQPPRQTPLPEEGNRAADLTSSSGYDARRVVLTYDGRAQSSGSAARPLVVTSGSHQLIVAAKSK